jgi:histidyl-tRNA synthetase
MDITVNEFLKRAIRTAEHFGFRSERQYKDRSECRACKETLSHTAKAEDRRLDGLFGLLSSGLSAYTAGRFQAIKEPLFFYSLEEVPRTGEVAVTFHVFNVEKSIAEAILIQTLRSLLFDIGHNDHVVKINSLGDTDSRSRYVRELNTYFRKRLEEMPPSARELLKEHPTSALLYLIEKQHELGFKSPNPLEHLSDQSRRHFREIVEYLDMSETPYEIEPKLLGSYQCFNDALFSFEINDERGVPLQEQPIQIRGGRYGTFFEKHLKQTVPAVGAVVILKGRQQLTRLPRATNKHPLVHLIQLGFAPKVRSLMLIDQLQKEGIIVNQDLASDSLSAQLRRAEEQGARYTVIIGQKEYVDGTVIFRDMAGKNQETIPQSMLAARLKRARVTAA